MLLVAGVRCSFPRKDAGSPRTQGTWATEDAVEGASSAGPAAQPYCAKPSRLQRLPRLTTRLILVPTASVLPARRLWLRTRPRVRFERA